MHITANNNLSSYGSCGFFVKLSLHCCPIDSLFNEFGVAILMMCVRVRVQTGPGANGPRAGRVPFAPTGRSAG